MPTPYRPPRANDFVGSTSGGSSVADLIMRSGQARAEAELRSGDRQADTINSAAQSLQGVIGDYFKRRDDDTVQNAVLAATKARPRATPGMDVNGDPTAETGPPDIKSILGSIKDPALRSRAMKGIQDWTEFDTKRQESDLRIKKLEEERTQRDLDTVAVGAFHAKDWLDQPDGGLSAITLLSQQAKDSKIPGAEQYDEFLAGAHDAWQAAGDDPKARANVAAAVREQAGPLLGRMMAAGSAGVQEKFQPKTRTLKSRDAAGNETEEIVPDVPGQKRTSAPEPAKPGTLEDYVTKKYGRNATPDQIAAARKVYNQSDDRPYRDPAPVVVVTAQGPQIVDRKSGTARPITDGGGSAVGLAPTADERNRAAAGHRAQPVLDSITELSEKINTGRGVTAKISGAVERAKAEANLNDDVSEYEAVVASFTPLLARAMGHSGVLTQQDVDSARAILPKPEDSKSIRDRKVARIKKLMGGSDTTVSPEPSKSKYKVEVVQ